MFGMICKLYMKRPRGSKFRFLIFLYYNKFNALSDKFNSRNAPSYRNKKKLNHNAKISCLGYFPYFIKE